MDYTAAAARASAKIKAKGQPATLSRTHSLGYDPSLTITVDATAKTFTRSSGSWLTDGFAAGDSVTFAGFSDAGNNGAFVASDVTDLVLTCSTATGLVDVTDAAGVTATASTTISCNAFKDDSRTRALKDASFTPGSLITEGTRAYLVTCGSKPLLGDKLRLSLETSAELIVKSCNPFSPGGIDLYYELVVAS